LCVCVYTCLHSILLRIRLSSSHTPINGLIGSLIDTPSFMDHVAVQSQRQHLSSFLSCPGFCCSAYYFIYLFCRPEKRLRVWHRISSKSANVVGKRSHCMITVYVYVCVYVDFSGRLCGSSCVRSCRFHHF